jgi:hypothetical protein
LISVGLQFPSIEHSIFIISKQGMAALPIRPAQLRCLSGISGRLYAPRLAPRACYITKWLSSRGLTTAQAPGPDAVPLRKHLKDEAKRKKAEAKASNNGNKKQKIDPRLEKWELTVGIEVHAELNTACKLFSNAPTASAEGNSLPNPAQEWVGQEALLPLGPAERIPNHAILSAFRQRRNSGAHPGGRRAGCRAQWRF